MAKLLKAKNFLTFCLEGRKHEFPVAHFRVLVCLWVKTSLSAKLFSWKFVSPTGSSIFMQIKPISMWKVLHEHSFWHRGKPKVGNGLLVHVPLNINLSPDLAGGRAEGEICSSMKNSSFLIACHKIWTCVAKLVRASREFDVSFLCKLDTMNAIVHFSHICLFTVSPKSPGHFFLKV